jgi:hypothetical protein
MRELTKIPVSADRIRKSIKEASALFQILA